MSMMDGRRVAPDLARGWRAVSGTVERVPTPDLFILPAIVPILVIVAFPLGLAVYLSLTSFQLLRQDLTFVGLDNYARLFADPIFWSALGTTIVFLLVTVNGSFLLGLAVSQGVARVTVGQGLMRTLIMVPMMFAPVLVGFQFRWFFNAQVGLVNNFLQLIGLSDAQIPWLVDRNTALLAVMIADIWMNTPIVAIILLAGRLSLPHDLEEAAQLDAASGWQTFRHVIMPQLMPFVFIALAIRSLDVARAFDIVQIMTGGGPAHRTELVWTYIFRTALQDGRFAVGAAMSLLTVLISIASVAYIFRQLMKARIIR
jgi:multiple sugar transport system permease protein